METLDVKEFAEKTLTITRQFVENGEEVLPTAFVFDLSGGLSIVGIPWTKDTKKRMLRYILDLSKTAFLVIFICDCYVRIVDPKIEDAKTVLEQVNFTGVKSDPKHVEALEITVMQGGKITSSAQQVYHRGDSIQWEPLTWAANDTQTTVGF